MCKALIFLLLLGAGSNVSAETIRPYILNLNRTAATICWVSNDEMRGKLTLYSISDQRTIVEDNPSRFHKIDMNNLIPGTRYRYEAEGVYHGEFETASSNDSFQVAVFGHPAGTESQSQYPAELLAQKI